MMSGERTNGKAIGNLWCLLGCLLFLPQQAQVGDGPGTQERGDRSVDCGSGRSGPLLHWVLNPLLLGNVYKEATET